MSADPELLKGVSRSFYLSIRALPKALREPVGLAYLLARTTDTIADTSHIEVALRLRMLADAAAAIQGQENEVARELRERFAPAQENEPERRLIESFDLLLQNLRTLAPADHADVRALLATITRGQELDISRWDGKRRALPTANDLREYTYLVAGCVGEFWTRLCFRKAAGFSARAEAEMLELGRRYGSGLQLVNILRDAGEDLRAGRCYFPEDELKQAGVSLENLGNAPAAFTPVYQRWIEEARLGLDAGLEYCIAVHPPRIRIASALPALLGVRTLELLQKSGVAALQTRLKVPRSEVHKLMASAAITLANPTRLRSLRARL